MKVNANTTITGDKVKLVPYRKEHVPCYHTWMQDPALQEATASESLSLQEELDMQISWSQDPDKCTFILLDPDLPDTVGTGSHGGGMVGDVNLFVTDADEPHTAELEIMVAEQASRQKGIAFEALNIFMAYAIKYLGINKFQVKIGDQNQSSLKLFAKLGFMQTSHSQIFHEVTLDLPVTEANATRYQQAADLLQFGTHD